LVPRVHAQEFCNVGVILHARTEGYLEARIEPDWRRIASLWPAFDTETARRHLEAFGRICRGEGDSSPIALLPPSERFHWLTAPRSGVLQTSSVAQGTTRDLAGTLARLTLEQCGEARG
jgi:hypothetical protein